MYVKLFADLLDSSLWSEDSDTRIVWITLLVMANQDGLVRSTLPGIAHRARVTNEAAENALVLFESPDKNSRTPDNDGRRIERTDGGYQILNYKTRRDMQDEDSRRAQWRESQRRRRAAMSTSVNIGQHESTHTDTEAEADTDTEAVKDIIRSTATKRPSRPKEALRFPANRVIAVFCEEWTTAFADSRPPPTIPGANAGAATRIAKSISRARLAWPEPEKDFRITLRNYFTNAFAEKQGFTLKYLQSNLDANRKPIVHGATYRNL